MESNKKLLFLLFIGSIVFHTSTLHAFSYNDDILNIFSKIIPRFVMMSSQKEKIKERLEICILHDDGDKLAAESLQKKINLNYPNGIKNHPMYISNPSYKKMSMCKKSQLIFLFNSDKKYISKALLFAHKNTILSMSYDKKLLQNGVAISLFIGRKVVPYINMQAIQENNIKLDGMLLRVSKIYVKKEK
jgi:hypothetical protein